MKSEKRIFISFILNFIFTIFEFVGGILTNSVALFSDAIHDFGDSISMGIAIFLEKKSKKKPDYNYTYGYFRFSLLGAMISSLILLGGSAIVVYEAITRLIHPETINSELVIYFAIFGVVVNGLAAINVSKGKTLNEKVISLHLLEDILGWVALLIAAIIMYFAKITILDSLLSIAFTGYILFNVFKNMRKIFNIFLEKAPAGFDIDHIKAILLETEHVLDIHHLHLWTLEGSIPLITLHAQLEDGLDSDTVSEIQNVMLDRLKKEGIAHATIQIEFSDTECIDEECVEPEKDHSHHHHLH